MSKIFFLLTLVLESVNSLGIPKENLELIQPYMNIQENLNIVFTNSCIEDLGCFYTGPPFFDKMFRPTSVAPCIPNIIFKLYTPSNPTEFYDLDITFDSVENSAFNPEFPLIFLLHGFMAKLEPTDFRHGQREAFLKLGNYNVIVVDWTEDNGPPYEQAVANIRSIGAKVAKLINFLIDNFGLSAENVHLIGHSLGTHMAGHIGERVPNLGRITGLEPAKPYFFGLEHEHEVVLDPTDALFVDVIHTDIVHGSEVPIGDVDIYVNGGSQQPVCITSEDGSSFLPPTTDDEDKNMHLNCDHSIANEYFMHSIDNSECQFLAVKCYSYEDFNDGFCSPEDNVVIEMGFHTKPITYLEFPAKFFLKTTGKAPYCIKSSFKI